MKYDGLRGCWNFTGRLSDEGYGRVSYKGKNVTVSRLAAHLWLRFDLNSPLNVLHRCDNPRCFNPKHLFIGTLSDNTIDSVRKRRHVNSRKTHCLKGHPYSPENTMMLPRKKMGGTFRACRICCRAANAKWKGT
jgi:hypothetical protein